MKHSPQQEQELISLLHSPQIKDNLFNFVMFAYPWGQPNTPLEHHKGPREWQKEDLLEMTEHIKSNKERIDLGLIPHTWKKATASGRGPGKSALVAWMTDWMLTTRIGSTTIITANTETQLKTRTFAEIGKWTNLLINSHWFETTVLSVKPAEWFGLLVKSQLKIDTGYYYAQGQLWSEENPDAFAGVHNPLGVRLIFDEASGVPAKIFSVSAGFFTEPVLDRYWDVYSNPRRNSGGFFDCFHPATLPVDGKEDPTRAAIKRAPWRLRQLDARTVEGLDQAEFQAMIDQHGIDSDTVRIEVLGQFPKQGNRQFISNQVVHDAQHRTIVDDLAAPLILGVDIARYGDDSTIFRFRKGRDARSIPAIKFKERDNMYIANKLAEVITHYNPDAVNIDAGNGTGVIDRVREMGYKVNEVWFGSSAQSKEWANKRTEMWADVRDWLGGGCIDPDPNLFRDLTAPEYDYFGKASDAVMLESKESLKGRGLPSPDDGDALALTFASRVARRDTQASKHRIRHKIADGIDYPIFG
jgi:hypothetical protein